MIPTNLPEPLRKLDFRQQFAMVARLHQPKGASRTSKPKTSDIDVEIRDMQRRQSEFDQKIQREFERMNYPLEFYRPREDSFAIQRQTKRHKTHFMPVTSPVDRNRRVQSVPPTSRTSIEKRSAASPRKFTPGPLTFTNAIEELPPLIKSLPIHQDPNLKFNKKKKPSSKTPSSLTNRLERMNSVFEKIEKVKNFKVKVDESGNKHTGAMGVMYECVDRMYEYTKCGIEQTLDGIYELYADSQRLDRRLKVQSDIIREELNENTAKISRQQRFKGHRRLSSAG